MFSVCKERVKIADKYVEARKQLIKNGLKLDNTKKKVFRSFDIKHVERQVNDFLKDVIYIAAFNNIVYYDTSDIPAFSDKTEPLCNHIVTVYYVEWPF